MIPMLIAIPVNPDSDENDEWDMLLRDLRDDVPHVDQMPKCEDCQIQREQFRSVDAWVYRFNVNKTLATQLINSAYAASPDLIIEKA